MSPKEKFTKFTRNLPPFHMFKFVEPILNVRVAHSVWPQLADAKSGLKTSGKNNLCKLKAVLTSRVLHQQLHILKGKDRIDDMGSFD